MANNDLSELEQHICMLLKASPGRTTEGIASELRHVWTRRQVGNAIFNLVSKSYIVGSHDTPIRYSAVGGGEL